MITLDPEFIGSLLPPTNLSEVNTINGKAVPEVPYARLPRMERLRVSGKIDTTEDASEGEADDTGDGPTSRITKEEREKKKMRGKNKSLKRYLRKQRKNVIDPTAVRCGAWDYTFSNWVCTRLL